MPRHIRLLWGLPAIVLLGCGDIVSPANTGAHRPTFAKAAGSKRPYLVTFAGDVVGSFVKLLDPKDPLGNTLSLDGETLSFVNSGGGGTTTAGAFAVCRATGLTIVESWSGYAGASWTDDAGFPFSNLGRSGGALSFIGRQNDLNGGWINLDTQNRADSTKSLNGVVTSYYNDDYALIGVGSWYTDPNQPDPADRCISFTVTATPQ